jgi:hypothetical protein
VVRAVPTVDFGEHMLEQAAIAMPSCHACFCFGKMDFGRNATKRL